MQLLELWQMANLVLKQIVKANGPLVRAPARGEGGCRLNTDRVKPKTKKTERFALLRLSLGTKELGNRLACSESV